MLSVELFYIYNVLLVCTLLLVIKMIIMIIL